MEHSLPGFKGGGGFQEEAKVFFYESMREVQSQGSETMETHVANTENCHHHSTGGITYFLVLLFYLTGIDVLLILLSNCYSWSSLA